MVLSRWFHCLVIVALLTGGWFTPMPAVQAAEADHVSMPCHEDMASQEPSAGDVTPHAQCKNCTMGCCMGQIPVSFVAPPPVFHGAHDTRSAPVLIAYQSAPPTTPPRV